LLEIKKIAAIDIGSNAIRLLISNVIISEDREPQFKKSSLVRVPIRLGADAFTNNGIISAANIERLINAMEAF
jgi:exopolyphosphatase/guanosine-5'-triphosphate,3'-diphosphate pyrophosphatase